MVGGGNVALRKIDTLLDYDTSITVIAPEVDEKIRYYVERNKLQLIEREYKSSEAGDYGLVIAASDNSDVNNRVHEDAQQAGVLVNVVDKPALCDFIFPAIIKRNCLTIAVSTDGYAPFLSGYLRLILDDVFPDRWGKIATFAATFRSMVQKEGPKGRENKMQCLDKFLQADWKAMLKEKSDEEITEEMKGWLTN